MLKIKIIRITAAAIMLTLWEWVVYPLQLRKHLRNHILLIFSHNKAMVIISLKDLGIKLTLALIPIQMYQA